MTKWTVRAAAVSQDLIVSGPEQRRILLSSVWIKIDRSNDRSINHTWPMMGAIYVVDTNESPAMAALGDCWTDESCSSSKRHVNDDNDDAVRQPQSALGVDSSLRPVFVGGDRVLQSSIHHGHRLSSIFAHSSS
jgi:hypothetical protein